MNATRAYIRIIINGLPIILLCLILSLIVASQIIKYTPARYVTVAKIKLDTKKYGVSNDQLYEDFDVFSSENKTETEAEVLASHLLIKKVIPRVYLNPQIQRVGRLRTTTLYKNSPFRIDSEISNPDIYGQIINLSVSNGYINGSYSVDQEKFTFEGEFDVPMFLHGNEITFLKNDSLISKLGLDLDGKYSVVFYSEEELITNLKERLQVSALDKELTVLRVVFKDDIPQRAADFNNMLCQIYMEDYVAMKNYAARKTVSFIDDKLNEVGRDLELAELELEQYRLQNNIVNVRQETETGIRQVADLQVQLVNTLMQEQAILELEAYLDSGNYFTENAIHVGFGDLLLTELVKRLKALSDEKIDLEMLYTEDSDEIKVVNAKMDEIKFYIEEAIRSNKVDIRVKREQLEKDLEVYSHQFDNIPIVERKLKILEREFQLQESVYNFLSQKRIEAFIASTSQTSFHRVIQPAYTPKTPVTPNTVLIRFLCGFFGLLIGGVIVVLQIIMGQVIRSSGDIERNSLIPLAGQVNVLRPQLDKDAIMLVKSLVLKGKLTQNSSIGVTAFSKKELGTTVEDIVNAISTIGYSVCFISVRDHAETGKSINIMEEENTGFSYRRVVVELNVNGGTDDMDKLKSYVKDQNLSTDFVIVESPYINESLLPLELFTWLDFNLCVLRETVSKISTVKNINLLCEEYGLNNVQLLLVGVDLRLVSWHDVKSKWLDALQNVYKSVGKVVKRIMPNEGG